MNPLLEAGIQAGASKAGAIAGQALIPIPGVGAAIGGALGGLAGSALTGLFKKKKPSPPPTRGAASNGVFMMGGKRYYKIGGKRIFQGPNHEQGGITLSNGDEVEGGEVGVGMSGGEYIFSKRIKVPGTNQSFADKAKLAGKRELLQLAGLQEKVTGRQYGMGGKRMYVDGGLSDDDPTRKILVDTSTGLPTDSTMDLSLVPNDVVSQKQSIALANTVGSPMVSPIQMRMSKPVSIPTVRPDKPLSDANAQLQIERDLNDGLQYANEKLDQTKPFYFNPANSQYNVRSIEPARFSTVSSPIVSGPNMKLANEVEIPTPAINRASLPTKNLSEPIPFREVSTASLPFQNPLSQIDMNKVKNIAGATLPYAGDIANITMGLLPNRIPKAQQVDRSVLSKLPTRYNVNPQLEANKRAANAVINNPASSPNNRLAALASRLNADTQTYATKENTENQMRSQYAQMADSLNARQEGYNNQYRQEKMITDANRLKFLTEGLTGISRTTQALAKDKKANMMDKKALAIKAFEASRGNKTDFNYLLNLFKTGQI